MADMNDQCLKSLFVVNPDSQPVKIRHYLKDAVRVLRRHSFLFNPFFTEAPGQAEKYVRQCCDGSVDAVIVAGGDGTINEVINGIRGKNIPIGILPFGDRNVLARELRIPLNLIQAAERLSKRQVRHIDLGTINGRLFALMASCGYDAHAVRMMDKRLKRIIHRYAYVWAGIKDFAGYRPPFVEIRIEPDSRIVSGSLVIVTNTRFYGGSHQIAPFAEIDDGWLDVCVYHGRTQIGLVHFALHVMSKRHLSLKNVSYHKAKRISLYASCANSIQIDGDFYGESPAEIGIEPGALRVFC